MTNNALWAKGESGIYDPETKEKTGSVMTPDFKNILKLSNVDKKSFKQIQKEVIDQKDELERVGMFVDMQKNIIWWYLGTKKNGMKIACEGKAKTWFELKEKMHMSVCFGNGVCYVCEDVVIPFSSLPQGYEWTMMVSIFQLFLFFIILTE